MRQILKTEAPLAELALAVAMAAAVAATGAAAGGCGPRGTSDSTVPATDGNPTLDSSSATDALPTSTDAAPFMCVEDALEPSNTCAVPAVSTTIVNMGPTTLGLCDANDYYDVRITAGQTETVTMTLDPAGGDLDIEIYDGANGCTTILSSTNAGTAAEMLMVTAPAGSGALFRCIHVFPKTPGETNNYTLDVVIN
jgi:hypothetical protein